MIFGLGWIVNFFWGESAVDSRKEKKLNYRLKGGIDTLPEGLRIK